MKQFDEWAFPHFHYSYFVKEPNSIQKWHFQTCFQIWAFRHKKNDNSYSSSVFNRIYFYVFCEEIQIIGVVHTNHNKWATFFMKKKQTVNEHGKGCPLSWNSGITSSVFLDANTCKRLRCAEHFQDCKLYKEHHRHDPLQVVFIYCKTWDRY